jgi:3-methylfumaryl-CoA hydratase
LNTEASRAASSQAIDLDQLRQWIGRTSSKHEIICPARVDDLAATLDRAESPHAGDPLPPLWHWLFFHPSVRQSDLGNDGHPARGTFLPPVPLPRRMWAGGRVEFHQPLRVNEEVKQEVTQEATQISTVKAVDFIQGSTGPLVFVTVGHEIQDRDGAVLIREEQDIVYRDIAAANAAAPGRTAAEKPEWSLSIVPSASLLFCYSALTFNAHRIHYDLKYATEVEGYPGLVVHGPLIATLLLELLHRFVPEEQIRSFAYRAVSPLFHIDPFQVCGRRGPARGEVSLWAQTEAGRLAMSATATLASSSH